MKIKTVRLSFRDHNMFPDCSPRYCIRFGRRPGWLCVGEFRKIFKVPLPDKVGFDLWLTAYSCRGPERVKITTRPRYGQMGILIDGKPVPFMPAARRMMLAPLRDRDAIWVGCEYSKREA